MDSGNNTYKERQSVKNVAEFLFEYYCAEKEYKLTRLGFDEKNKNVDNFFKLNKFLRNIPDYIVNTPKGTFVVNVKGTGNFKEKEILCHEYEIIFQKKLPREYGKSVKERLRKIVDSIKNNPYNQSWEEKD